MINHNVKTSNFSKITHVHFILPILFTIIISIFLAQFTVSIQLQNKGSVSLFDSANEFFVTLNILFIILISMVSLFIFFRLFKKRRELAVRILVATFILSGIMSILLFTKLLFNTLKLEFPLILIVVAIVTYIGAYFGYLVIIDSISNRMRNTLFIICSGILGSFFGVLVPTFPIIVSLLLLSFVDIILIKRKTVEKIFGETAYEKILTEIAFSSKEWGIGIGDLTCYSIIVANTAANFGFLSSVFSLLLILVGSFLSLRITLSKGRLPGLPVSIILGLLPAIIQSIFL
jgi:hypothetical protein